MVRYLCWKNIFLWDFFLFFFFLPTQLAKRWISFHLFSHRVVTLIYEIWIVSTIYLCTWTRYMGLVCAKSYLLNPETTKSLVLKPLHHNKGSVRGGSTGSWELVNFEKSYEELKISKKIIPKFWQTHCWKIQELVNRSFYQSPWQDKIPSELNEFDELW